MDNRFSQVVFELCLFAMNGRRSLEKKLQVFVTVCLAAAGLMISHLEAKDVGGGSVDTRAREAEITEKPPRIPPLKAEELKKEDLDAINKIRRTVNMPPVTEPPAFVATLARHPSLYHAHSVLAHQLSSGELPVRDRELIVMRIGWLCQAPFEWSEHVRTGKRLGGLTDEDVERVIVGSAAPGWNEADRALLRAVEELYANAMITDETWAVLSRSLNEKQLIELPLLVGQYQGLAYYTNSVRIRLMPGSRGLSER